MAGKPCWNVSSLECSATLEYTDFSLILELEEIS